MFLKVRFTGDFVQCLYFGKKIASVLNWKSLGIDWKGLIILLHYILIVRKGKFKSYMHSEKGTVAMRRKKKLPELCSRNPAKWKVRCAAVWDVAHLKCMTHEHQQEINI